MSADELVSLVNLISSSVKTVIETYASANQNPPSMNSATPGSFDTPESQPAELAEAIRLIEASCAQLAFTVASPNHVMTNKAQSHIEPACLEVVAEGKVADILRDKPDGLPVDKIAYEAGLPANKLGRIMRLLATKHCFREVRPNVFANNRLSTALYSENPVSSLIGHFDGEVLQCVASLNDTLADPKVGASDRVADAAFTRVFGMTGFEYFEKNKYQGERFNRAMVGYGMVSGSQLLLKAYPWGGLPEGTTISDIGGGNGHVMLDLVKSFPQLHVIVQDLPHVIPSGLEMWTQKHPEAVKNKAVEFVEMDFFKDAPVKDCDLYYLRYVLHDWPDAECLTILSNVRKAMKAGSKLLIHDAILQYASREPQQDEDADKGKLGRKAPEPLLPNYGMGNVRPYTLDIEMMAAVNSKQHTLDDLIEFGDKTGFKFVKLWDAGETDLVEFTTV